MVHVARWLVVIACIVVTMVTTRAAMAAAPFCDERGMSANAPPPVMPARDIRIDLPSYAPPCILERWSLDDAAAGPNRAPHPCPDSPAIEALPVTDRMVFPPLPAELSKEMEGSFIELPQGHAPGVFHPPRR